MAYEPTNWKSGDVVTSSKLNKMEQGIAGGGGSVLVVHEVDGALDATWRQIVDALHGTGVILECIDDRTGYTNVFQLAEYAVDQESGHHILAFTVNKSSVLVHYYSSETEDGYPINDD